MKTLAKQQPFHAVRFDGTIYDCGAKIGFLAANVAYALERDDLAGPLKAELAKLREPAEAARRVAEEKAKQEAEAG
jgi:UTP--glucose-1-phosphate uridylyltransferase